MTTIERPPLAVLSANTLKRAHTDFGKQSLPNLKSIIPRASFPSLTNSLNSKGSITKPSPYQTHARKLKYRLKLAYYKLQTDQIGVPLTEIIKNHNDTSPVSDDSAKAAETKPTTSLPPSQKRKLNTTPSLTRHISLLAASTPLHGSSYAPILPKKSVTFKRSNSFVEPPTFSTASASTSNTKTFNDQNEKKEEEEMKKKEKTTKLPRISEYPTFKIDTKKIRLTSSSPNLDRSLTTQPSQSLRIQDLMASSATPVKPYRRDNDILFSSPTKTPGSYGAAKSLLQLSYL